MLDRVAEAGNLRARPGVTLYVSGARGWMALAIVALLAGCGGSVVGSTHGAVSAGAPSTPTAPATVSPPNSGSSTIGSLVTTVLPPPTTAPSTSTRGPTGAGPTTAAPVPPPGSGIYGVVSAGPTCPVERVGQPCLPSPVSATVTARNTSTGTLAVTHSDNLGRYTLPLPPGTYTVSASTGSPLPRCSATTATVTSSGAARTDIACDTGIR